MLTYLKADYATFKTFMFIHLEEEEKFWPSVFLKYGKPEAEKARSKIISEELSKKGQTAIAVNNFLGAMLDAIGYPESLAFGKDGIPAEYKVSGAWRADPWAGDVNKSFLDSVPFIPRVFIFPGAYKGYVTKWKLLIDSITGDRDIMLVPGPSAPQAPVGCGCTIS